MSKDSNTQHRTTRQHPPTKIIVERHYAGTEKWKKRLFKDDGTNNESMSNSTQKTMLKDSTSSRITDIMSRMTALTSVPFLMLMSLSLR